MPPIRGEFETVKDQISMIKCCICSNDPTARRDVIIKKSSKGNHLNSKTHQYCKERYLASGNSLPNGPSTGTMLPLSGRYSRNHFDEDIPAVLHTIEQMHLPDSMIFRDDAVAQDLASGTNPFDNMVEHDGQLYDHQNRALVFSAGNVTTDEETSRQNEIWRGIQGLSLYDSQLLARVSLTPEDLFGESDCLDDTTIADSLAAFRLSGGNVDDESEAESDCSENMAGDVEGNDRWSPHGSKSMFFLDLLDNLPRLRLSNDHMKAIIWVMRECGTPDVPTFYALRKKQKELTAIIPNISTKSHTSALGNKFYMNHPADLLALDWANPCVRPHIQLYPEITSRISESWQADKYTKEVPFDQLTPMWADWKTPHSRHFYVNEIALTCNNEYVIPIRWIVADKQECAEVYSVIQDNNQDFVLRDPQCFTIKASTLRYNYLDIESQIGHILTFKRLPNTPVNVEMPHPVRVVAEGRPAFCIRIMPWADDVSGNKSKQYNAHMNLYVANINLPHRKLAQEYFVRFCSTSPDASSSEQFDALSKDVRSGEWHKAYDCELDTEIIFQIFVHLLPADNPQQAESSSNAGANAKHWCRADNSGGTAQERESDEGYHALFHQGVTRTPQDTIEVIKQQILAAGTGVKDAVEILQLETGVKDRTALFWIDQIIEKARLINKSRLYTRETRDPRLNDSRIKGPEREVVKSMIKKEIQNELFEWVLTQPPDRYAELEPNSPLRKCLRPGDHYNILLDIPGLDPHRDTPVEILHTVLLGVDKYLWYDTSNIWDKKQDRIFAIRLQSSSIDGLSLPPLRADYMVHYKNSLVGKHFKALQQLGTFHLRDDTCTPELFNLWKANGELGAMLWIPEIDDIDQYLADLQVLLDNVLDLWAIVDPTRITKKLKLHVLGAHTRDDIRRFGPAILFSTEVFECWNAVFRLCSVLSNHHAPSRDIATTLGNMERFKHQVSGGWWKNNAGVYIQAGEAIRALMDSNKNLQQRLGWVDESKRQIGSVKLESKKLRNPSKWDIHIGDLSQACIDSICPEIELWSRCKHVIARSRDICKQHSWIFFEDNDGSTVAGQILGILFPSLGNPTAGKDAAIIVEHYTISSLRDQRLRMPVLVSATPKKVTALSPKTVLFVFNTQHDCLSAGCALVEHATKQGCDTTSIMKLVVAHKDLSRYFINLHALHNAHLIRKVIPRELWQPEKVFCEDCRPVEHVRIASQARDLGETKRLQTLEKTKVTRAQKLAASKAKDTQG